ncbi:flagellar motor switch protein FliM [Acidithiobacillus sp. HP-6]|uniref:flagellar motor switch protein FliM n=1 Tax=unclassified Acidithiobacillus TaxID=2614800 RepID=UPI0018793388|nr:MULTISPECIES: flagellar motor switch protein FliM [unclassified Acidithiobacillus]MBE7562881.1 flagellar motor switch protein FliM [Acidithiobacillus sp. HP-6]MBE7568194.1 flagellar motor switch protein FliM [Acidithiobacillus sp. HP-2]MDD2748468.1 flagellar motor switch protein FliM [Acidithiobacillus sp.]MDD5278227.1 flagellar motor switch protein FliM [Acidithiobacillus sp.]
MVQDILSQDEVDALFKGMSDGEVETQVEPEPDPGGVRPYDLANQDRIVRGRMPTLEVVNERFARLWRVSLFNFLRRTAEISVGPVRLIKYSEFIRRLVVPSNINIVQIKPLRGSALFVFDPRLIFAVVDNYFGGDGRFHARIEGREFTPLEQRIIKRLLDLAFKDFKNAWTPVTELNPELTRSEVNPQFVSIATPTEVVIVSTFNVELESGSGTFEICLPYGMVEPVRDQLTAGTTADRSEIDRRWVQSMQDEMQEASLEMEINFLQTQLTLRQLLALRDGDIIPVEMPEEVFAQVDGIPIFSGRYGVSNGKIAVQLEKHLCPEMIAGHAAIAAMEN